MARSRRRTQDPPPQRLILDSGAVIALSRNDQRGPGDPGRRMGGGGRGRHPVGRRRRERAGSAKDAPVDRVIKSVGEVTAADEATGRVAGALLGAARSSTIDAVVVAAAIELGGGVVLTGDPADLEPLADAHPEVVIRAL
jgi:hypothetical protein